MAVQADVSLCWVHMPLCWFCCVTAQLWNSQFDYREHDWFKKDLPAYLFPSPTDHDASIIDVDVVREVIEVS